MSEKTPPTQQPAAADAKQRLDEYDRKIARWSSENKATVALLISSLLTITVIMLAASVLFGRQSIGLFSLLVVVTAVSFYPLSYISYHQYRKNTHKERIREDFQLLGINQEDLDALYDTLYSWQQYLIYVFLASATTMLGFGLLFFGADLSLIGAASAQTMFYSFLGAFVFSVYFLYRRYITLDLQPGVYLYVTMRMLTVMGMGYIAAQLFAGTTGETPAALSVAAFMIGYIPDTGINLFKTVASRAFTVVAGAVFRTDLERNERKLSEIDGISIWHEVRLREIGIDNVQNLASADVRQILLNSRFSAQQLMHWIDQAILMMNLSEEKSKAFNQMGVRTITAFRLLIDTVPEELPAITGVTTSEFKTLYHAATTGPNLHYVTAYWRAVERYRPSVVDRNLSGLIGLTQLARFDIDDVQAAALFSNIVKKLDAPRQKLEQLFPDDADALLGLGNAYTEGGRPDQAVPVLSRVLGMLSTGNRLLPAAYSSRGQALVMLGKFDDAFADFDSALEIDPHYAVAHNQRGIAYLRLSKFHQAITCFDLAIKHDPHYALAYYNKGFTLRQTDAQGNKVGGSVAAMELLDRAIELHPELTEAYFQRALTFLEQKAPIKAVADLDALIRIDRSHANAYAYRGLAYLTLPPPLQDLRRAIYDFDISLEIDPQLVMSYANRGFARLQLKEWQAALVDLTKALERSPDAADALKNRAFAYLQQSAAVGPNSPDRTAALSAARDDLQRYLALSPAPAEAETIRQLLAAQIEPLLTAAQPVVTQPLAEPVVEATPPAPVEPVESAPVEPASVAEAAPPSEPAAEPAPEQPAAPATIVIAEAEQPAETPVAVAAPSENGQPTP